MQKQSPLPKWYFDIFNRYRERLQQKEALYLALSAGVDSNTLLHWLYTFRAELPPIYTIHVNHNWHENYSHLWANFARQRAEFYGFTHYHYEAYFNLEMQSGLEAAGREMRYIKFAETMKPNSLLCVAHHRSDQAETLMQRLLRSSGTRGLGAMRDFNTVRFGTYDIDLFRPFLSISKKELYETAIKLNLPWLEDYTNHETDDMERNIIRNDLFKRMESTFPQYEEAFYQVTQFMQEADDLLLELAMIDLQKITQKNSIKGGLEKKNISQLHLPSLKELSLVRQKNLLQAWLRPYNLIFSQRQLTEFIRVFLEGAPTHQTRFELDPYVILYFQDYLYLEEKSEVLSSFKSFQLTPSSNAPSRHFWQQFSADDLLLEKRKGGERFHPLYRDRSQQLKKLLQEAKIPVWERDHCWLLKIRESGEILWVNHLGFAKSLENEIKEEGLAPALIATIPASDNSSSK